MQYNFPPETIEEINSLLDVFKEQYPLSIRLDRIQRSFKPEVSTLLPERGKVDIQAMRYVSFLHRHQIIEIDRLSSAIYNEFDYYYLTPQGGNIIRQGGFGVFIKSLQEKEKNIAKGLDAQTKYHYAQKPLNFILTFFTIVNFVFWILAKANIW